MRKRGTTNPNLMELIRLLRKVSNQYKARIWRALADHISRSHSRRITVNISRLNRYTREGDIIVVPGKVLGAGILDHAVTIAALAFSKQAQEKILMAKGKCISIQELIKLNPKGSNVKIIG
ncbi:MAG: 50S ribosomal protein L18e [Candidatus Bathyarchaeia archaeon]